MPASRLPGPLPRHGTRGVPSPPLPPCRGSSGGPPLRGGQRPGLDDPGREPGPGPGPQGMGNRAQRRGDRPAPGPPLSLGRPGGPASPQPDPDQPGRRQHQPRRGGDGPRPSGRPGPAHRPGAGGRQDERADLAAPDPLRRRTPLGQQSDRCAGPGTGPTLRSPRRPLRRPGPDPGGLRHPADLDRGAPLHPDTRAPGSPHADPARSPPLHHGHRPAPGCRTFMR
jgi:hypothetical protein